MIIALSVFTSISAYAGRDMTAFEAELKNKNMEKGLAIAAVAAARPGFDFKFIRFKPSNGKALDLAHMEFQYMAHVRDNLVRCFIDIGIDYKGERRVTTVSDDGCVPVNPQEQLPDSSL